jgi:hypothetical protein
VRAGVLMAALAACTGRGGGYLPPDAVSNGQGSFGFSFSCQDAGGINPSPGKLQIQLDYTDHGISPLGSPFSVHGTVDSEIDPVVESAACIGQQPAKVPGQLTFLGSYRATSTPSPEALASCPSQGTSTSPMCRFEVTVKDNDGNFAPSPGDFFKITLVGPSSCVDLACSQLTGTVLYTRAGILSGGNITVN